MPAHQLLIIDSSVQTLTLVKNALEAKNFKVLTARDIQRAFDLIRSNPPSMVITNTRLPELMPFEIYYQLLEATGESVPIVALSNSDTDQERASVREAGFAAFINKPIQLRSMLATIKQVLEGRKHSERREPRHNVSIDIIIHILDDRGRIIDTEQTISDNMSRRGACLLTLNAIEVGDTITVSTLDNSFQSRAVVRGSYLGIDRIRRINIEFLDEKWQDEWLVNLD